MDLSIVYSKTAKGLRARASLIGGLPSHLMRVLTHVDGTTKAESILNKYSQITEQELAVAITQLEREGYIKAIVPTKPGDNDWALTINFTPMEVEEVLSVEEAEAKAKEAARLQAEREAQAAEDSRLEAENKAKEAERKAQEKAELAREKAKAKAEAKVNAQLEIERIAREAEAERQKIAAEKKSKAEEAARLAAETKAKAEEEARQKAEIKAKQEAEARQQIEAKLEAERKAREELEARLEAERKAREEAEQAHAKAESETKESARREIERIAREAEEAQKKLEADMLAKAQELERKTQAEEAERKALESKAEAEKAARLEAERIAQEKAQELERMAQAELQAKAEAERLAKEAEQERVKKESEAKNKESEKERARLEIARIVREAEEARKQADAKAKEERLEAKRKAKAEAEQKKAEAEALAKAEQAAKLEAKRKAKAEQEASIEAEHKAKESAEQNRLQAEKDEKAGADAKEKASLAMAQFALQIDEDRKKSEEIIASEKPAQEPELEKTLKANTEAEFIRAKVEAEERAKLEAQALASLEMTRIAQEAKMEREKEEVELAPESKNAIVVRWNADPDGEDDDDEAFEDEEHLVEEENKIKQVIEKKNRRESEEQGREDIKREAKDHALEMAQIKGARSVINYGKWVSKALKFTFVYLPMFALLLIALLHFVNISPLIEPIQKIASESLGEPVKINEVHASLWPQPHFVLGNVIIGNSNNPIKALHVVPETASLSEAVKRLESIEIEGLQIDQTNLAQAQQWINNLGKAQHLQLAQINLKKITFKMRDLEMGPFDGKVALTESKQLNSIDLNSVDRTLAVLLTPQGDSANLVFTGTNWALPMNKKLVFDEFKATGKLSESMIYFSQIEGRLYGGSLSAKAAIDWSSQWSLAGNFDLSKATLPLILKAFASGALVDGKLNLAGIFSSKSEVAAKLTDNPEITAKFEVRDGKINGVDLEQAMMPTAGKSLAGDATRFDTLTGLVKINDARYEYKQLVLATDQFHAAGSVNIEPDQAISGSISADLAAQSRRLQTKFDLAGKVNRVQRQ